MVTTAVAAIRLATIVCGADTDASPYDSGSYASSTTYVTGKAVELACEELKENMCKIAAGMMDCDVSEVEFYGGGVRKLDGSNFVSRFDIASKSMMFNNIAAQTTATHCSPVSPPPYMAGMVEIELDKETGKVDILDYVAVIDCGTPINPNLARIQAEGGIVQGIGMALYENVTYLRGYLFGCLTGAEVVALFMKIKINIDPQLCCFLYRTY